jgi:hypothetical protein
MTTAAPPTTQTGYGTTEGAAALLASLTALGASVPAAWKTGSGKDIHGAYEVDHNASSDGSGIGSIEWTEQVKTTISIPGIWPGVSGTKYIGGQMNFAWNTAGVVTGTSAPTPVTSTPITAPTLLQQIGNALSDIGIIFTAQFWKRVGEILLGVTLLVIGFIVLLKFRAREEPAT